RALRRDDRLALGHEGEALLEGLGRDLPVGAVEDGLAVREEDHLRRFVPDARDCGDEAAGRPRLDDSDHAAVQVLAPLQALRHEAEALHGVVAGAGLEDDAGGVAAEELVDVLGGAEQNYAVLEHALVIPPYLPRW